VTTKNEPDQFPHLGQIADPVGKRSAGRISRAWEREAEITELTHFLREEGVSVCIVGESGCGKTSILVEATRRLAKDGDDGTGVSGPRFWLSSASRIVAGMRYLGEWEQRCEAAIRELANLRGVLCIENLLELVSAGGSGPESSLASFLTPYLRNGELRIVAEATPREIEACDRLLPGLIDEMQVLKMEEFVPK
ncbi:MAG: ATP-dependent Clp protease ATP-binding subunit, partial [Cyanobacteria bacterium P01_A01_bin.68]